MHLYGLPTFRALPLVFSFEAIIVHYALKTLSVRQPSLSPGMTSQYVAKIMNKYPSSVILLSFAFLMSMFVPMTMIFMFAL